MTNATAYPTIVERPAVKVQGSPLTEAIETNLIDARVDLVTNGVSQATLRFYDADFKIADTFTIGSALEIAFPKPGSAQQTVVFTGVVFELAMEQGPNDLHELVVTAFDKGHLLARTVEAAAYTNMTYTDVISKIARDCGLTASLEGLPEATFKHLLQATDHLTFLNDIAARSGVTWRVVGEKLIVGAGVAPTGGSTPKPEIAVTWGHELRRFTTRLSAAGATGDVTARGWDIQAKRDIVGLAGTVSTALSAADGTETTRGTAYGLSDAKKILSNRIVDSQQEAEAVAASVRQRMDSGLTQARGELVGDPAVVPGATLVVSGMGPVFSGKYVLTSVEHVYTTNGYVSRFQAGTMSTSTLADVLGGERSMHGAMVGIVTANDDDDLAIGRVKVRLPMLSETVETDWARVITLGGGASRGIQVTPAVNDEVIVIFENGDLRRPIVLGGVWNGSDQPPMATGVTTSAGVTKVWHMKTAAGHYLTFDERDGEQTFGVTIMLKDGQTKLYLGDQKVELWSNDKPLEVKSGQASMLLSNNDVTINGLNINLKAQQGIKLEGNNIEGKANLSLKLGGTMVEVNGQASVDVAASGATSIKGAVVKIN